MEKTILYLIISVILLNISCTENKPVNLNKIKAGDYIHHMQVLEITHGENLKMVFDGNFEFKGKLIYNPSPYSLGIEYMPAAFEVLVNDNTVDLSLYKTVIFENPEILDEYITENMLIDVSGDKDLKPKYKNKIEIKVIVKDITYHFNKIHSFTAKITEIKEFKLDI